MAFEIKHGDCLEVMRGMPDNSVDAIVTDPPYGLSFMGKKWDYDVPSVEVWSECLRVLKPGGHLLAFAGTRTQHRMAVRIEDAGFEIRDMIAWVYGSGFPKSLDVSKAIDKAAGAEREVIGSGKGRTGAAAQPNGGSSFSDDSYQWPGDYDITTPATDAARQWQGWGTALKPALEPITVARKPLVGTVAENVLEHGTGALNIDGCRVATSDNQSRPRGTFPHSDDSWGNGRSEEVSASHEAGRWPANLIHDGSEEVLAGFPQSSVTGKRSDKSKAATVDGTTWGTDNHQSTEYTDTGSAARFFYCAKASKADRDEGLSNPATPFVQFQTGNGASGKPSSLSEGRNTEYRNHHPTVKPTALMRYLCRLVTPPGGTVLDPFTGSGSTGRGAVLEGFSFIGIEREAEYIPIAEARIAEAQKSLGLFA